MRRHPAGSPAPRRVSKHEGRPHPSRRAGPESAITHLCGKRPPHGDDGSRANLKKRRNTTATRLELSIALSDNERTRPILEGRVTPQGIKLFPTMVHPSEMFSRQLCVAD